jgi:hypothetical protein
MRTAQTVTTAEKDSAFWIGCGGEGVVCVCAGEVAEDAERPVSLSRQPPNDQA